MSFCRNHPILSGIFILAGISFLFIGGISLLFSVAMRNSRASLFPGHDEGIGVVELKGIITSPEEAIEALTDFRTSKDIKAVVLRVDSPGGAVGAAQEIYREVKRTDAVKPVVASMGSLGASGGYYVSIGARRIIANPGTLTGSLGVIVKFANLEELFEKVGYKSVVIKSGELKDVGAAHRPMTEEEQRMVQGVIDTIHAQFVASVAEDRHLDLDTVRALADGRIMSGEQAFDAGLVDELGNFTDAVIAASSLAGLATDNPPLIYPEKKDGLLGMITGRSSLLLDTLANMKNLPMLFYEWRGIN